MDNALQSIKEIEHFLLKYNIESDIVGGCCVAQILDLPTKDIDVGIWDACSLDALCEALEAEGYVFEFLPAYESIPAEHCIDWVVKTYTHSGNYPVDFIRWTGVDNLKAGLLSFDFDINQAWYDDSLLCTHAASQAYETGVTYQVNSEVISPERLQHLQEKFPDFTFIQSERP